MENAKQKYISAFLDGYFSDKKVEYGIQYYLMLDYAIDIAEKKWEKHKKLEFPNPNLIDKWLDENGCPEIAKKVKKQVKNHIEKL